MSGAELLTDAEIETIETRWNEQRVRVEAGAVPDPVVNAGIMNRVPSLARTARAERRRANEALDALHSVVS